MNPENVAGILFSTNRKEVLLIQRRDVPVWVLPGRGIEPGESPEAAVTREILEETGLTVKVARLVGEYTPINRLAKQTHLYESIPISGSLSLSDETRGVAFFPLNELPRLIPHPYREWIQDSTIIADSICKRLESVTYAALIKNTFSHPILVIRFILARAGLTVNSR